MSKPLVVPSPGYKTTEFWLTVAAAIGYPLVAYLFERDVKYSIAASFLSSAIVIVSYSNSRKGVKEAQVRVEGIHMTTSAEMKKE